MKIKRPQLRIIFFTHPTFFATQSMPKYAKTLSQGMQAKGHVTELWTAKAKLSNRVRHPFIKKWLQYIDQFLIFPIQVRKKLKTIQNDVLFVFTDHALGPWIPLIKGRPHVIHCHDFLAQLSAKNMIPENPTSWTGKQYQTYIWRGYRQGKNFISVSHKTKTDLHTFLQKEPKLSEVVYNPLIQKFGTDIDTDLIRRNISNQINICINDGYILHVGGNQWYKNRKGVIEIYETWRKISKKKFPLLMIGLEPDNTLFKIFEMSQYKSDIHFLINKPDAFVKEAYQGASILLYPSLAEGFGWPIAEAMACGCMVLTTGEAPMNEVGLDAAFYIERKPSEMNDVKSWINASAKILEKALSLTDEEKKPRISKGLSIVNRFSHDNTLNIIEGIYKRILTQTNR